MDDASIKADVTNANDISISDAQQRLLQSVYYDPANVGSFSTAWSLYSQARKKQPQIPLTLNTTRTWLQSQTTHSLHKRVHRKFPRRRFRVQRVNEQWQIDVGYVEPLEHWNGGVRYLLYAIDVLSRFLYVEPLKRLDGPAATVAFAAILKRAKPNKPEMIFSDIGSNFISKPFQKLLRENGIRHILRINPEYKAAICER